MMKEKVIQQTFNQVGSAISGTATIGGGVWSWLDSNAGAIGVVFTALSCGSFILFQYLSHKLRREEHALNVQREERISNLSRQSEPESS